MKRILKHKNDHMKDDKEAKGKPSQNQPNVFTPEPPQVMNPSERSKKDADDGKHSKDKKKEKKK